MAIVSVGKLFWQVPAKDEPSYTAELCSAMRQPIKEVIQHCLESELRAEVDRCLERGHYVRRKRSKKRKVKERCSRCLSHQRQKFMRNGCYRRSLNTGWGRIELNVPQVKCTCGGNVRLNFRVFRPGQRMWDDLDIEVRVDYGRGLSYRQIKADWDERLGSSVGLCTLNRRVVGRITEEIPTQRLKRSEVPPVVRVDGIWITVMFPTGETCKDRSGRTRPVKQAKKVPILAAQGIWPDTGRSVLLAWTLADGEDHDSWQAFLEQLLEMGISPENGLALLVADGSSGFRSAYESRYWMVPLQRCVFHKLHNMAEALRTPVGLDRQAARLYRTDFLRQAAQIWQADDETEARQRYRDFCQQWQSLQPKAIAALTRDFDLTLTFYLVQQQAASQGQVWPAHILRTTSPLERLFREFRRRFRNAVLFHSQAGAIAATAQLALRFS